MTEKKQQHKKKRGKVQHIRGSPKKRKISGKAVFSTESIPGKMLADVKNLITDKVSELKRADQKKLFLANFPYLMFAYFFNKIAWLYRVNTGATSWDKFMNTITYFELAFQNLWPSLNHIDLLCGIAGGVVVKLIIIYRTKNARKYRLGVEYGSEMCIRDRHLISTATVHPVSMIMKMLKSSYQSAAVIQWKICFAVSMRNSFGRQ